LPRPDFGDYLSARGEQGCASAIVLGAGAVIAFVVFLVGEVAQIRVMAAIAAIILVATVLAAVFVAHDVNRVSPE